MLFVAIEFETVKGRASKSTAFTVESWSKIMFAQGQEPTAMSLAGTRSLEYREYEKTAPGGFSAIMTCTYLYFQPLLGSGVVFLTSSIWHISKTCSCCEFIAIARMIP